MRNPRSVFAVCLAVCILSASEIASVALARTNDVARKERLLKIENELASSYHSGDDDPLLSNEDQKWLKDNQEFAKREILIQLRKNVTYGSVFLVKELRVKEALPELRKAFLRADEDPYSGESLVFGVTDLGYYDFLRSIRDLMVMFGVKEVATSPEEKKNLAKRAEKSDSALAVLFVVDSKLGNAVTERRLRKAVSENSHLERCVMAVALFGNNREAKRSIDHVQKTLGRDGHPMLGGFEYPCFENEFRSYWLQIRGNALGGIDAEIEERASATSK